MRKNLRNQSLNRYQRDSKNKIVLIKRRPNQKLKHRLRSEAAAIAEPTTVQSMRGRKKRMKREWMLEAIREEARGE